MITIVQNKSDFEALIKIYGDREVVRKKKILFLCSINAPSVELHCEVLIKEGKNKIKCKKWVDKTINI